MSLECNDSDEKFQAEKFKRLARELECDKSEERFDECLKCVARHDPPPENAGDKPKNKTSGK